jgi:hypothetical protein
MIGICGTCTSWIRHENFVFARTRLYRDRLSPLSELLIPNTRDYCVTLRSREAIFNNFEREEDDYGGSIVFKEGTSDGVMEMFECFFFLFRSLFIIESFHLENVKTIMRSTDSLVCLHFFIYVELCFVKIWELFVLIKLTTHWRKQCPMIIVWNCHDYIYTYNIYFSTYLYIFSFSSS